MDKLVPVRPGIQTLYVAQNRLREKEFLLKSHIPLAAFRSVQTLADLNAAVKDLGMPSVLKTAGFGYDGKGQCKIASDKDLESAWQELNGTQGVLEQFVNIDKEFSVIGAISASNDRQFAYFGPIENEHKNHILDLSKFPAAIPADIAIEAVECTKSIMSLLGTIGLLCVEFFLTKEGKLLVNELAPRPHNSGHLTLESNPTSQFEQQIRAVTGIGLGATNPAHPTAMANLLGDLWNHGEPDWAAALATSQVHLHLYGKSEARVGRKMGHLTAVADTIEDASTKVLRARQALTLGK